MKKTPRNNATCLPTVGLRMDLRLCLLMSTIAGIAVTAGLTG